MSTTTSQSTPVSTYDAIVATVQHYFDGGKTGSSATMKRGFHANATIHGFLGPDLISGPIQELFDWVDANEAAAGLDARVTSVDVAGTIATVRIEMDNWSGHQFTDMLTLLLVEGQWLITCKVFHLH